jgi:Domain of unknown function (DUF4190)
MSERTPPVTTLVPAPTNTMAILSLVAGIAGLSVLPFIGSIVAVILGPIAKRDIDASGGAQTGEGLATAGTILGWVGIGLSVLGLCLIGVLVLLPLLFGLGIWGAHSTSTSLVALAAFA